MKIFNPFKEAITEIKNWFNAQVDLYQMRGIKKAVEISSQVSFTLLIMIFILLGFSFLSIALALYIGQLLHSYALGFLIIGAVPLLLMAIMLIFKQSTFRLLLDFFTRIFTKQ